MSYPFRPAAAPKRASWLRLAGASTEGVRFPAHRREDSSVTARMIEEEEFLDRPQGHLAVVAEQERGFGEAVWLTCGVQAEHVGLVLVGANDVIGHRRDRIQVVRMGRSHV